MNQHSHQHQPAPTIELGRRVRIHLPYHDIREGLIVAVHGEPGKNRDRVIGPMTMISPGACRFDVVTFDGTRHDCRESCIGRPGIGRVDLLDRVHGPRLIEVAIRGVGERRTRELLERAKNDQAFREAEAARVIERAPRFYWNGLKDDKGAKLQRAWYSDYGPNGSTTGRYPPHTIAIYADGYSGFSALVRECFAIENETDSMTDYFDKDTIHVIPAHPLYPQVKAALEAQEVHRAKVRAKRSAK